MICVVAGEMYFGARVFDDDVVIGTLRRTVSVAFCAEAALAAAGTGDVRDPPPHPVSSAAAAIVAAMRWRLHRVCGPPPLPRL